MDKVYKAINATKILNDNLNNFINVFTMYYGEDLKDEIVEKFNQMMFIGYQKPEDIKRLITNEKEKLSNNLLHIIFDKYNINNDLKKILLGYGNFFDAFEYSPIIKYYNWLNDFKLGKDERINQLDNEVYELFLKYIPNLDYNNYKNRLFTEDELKQIPSFIFNNINLVINEEENFKKQTLEIIKFLSQIFPEINENNYLEYLNSGKLDILEKISLDCISKKKEYDKYVNDNYLQVLSIIDKMNQIKSTYKTKFYLELINEFKELLNEEDFLKFQEYQDKKLGSLYSIDGIKVMFGDYLTDESALVFFSEKYNVLLNDNKTSNYRKEEIKKQRINYFKYMGYNLGDDYNNYIQDSQILEIWPSSDLVSNLISKKEYYQKKVEEEYYNSYPIYQEIRDKINKLGLLDIDSFNKDAYLNNLTSVNPNVVMKNGKYYLYSLILIYEDMPKDADKKIIHELNHLFELFLLSVDDNKYQMITGWDYINGSFKDSSMKDSNENKRDYELFSEIINELIAQEITEMMHNQGIYIFNTVEDAVIKGTTSYEDTFILVKDFFSLYKNDIILSRRNNNIKIILDKVGKDNFDNLNQLIIDFTNQLGGLNRLNLFDDLNVGRETERVKIYREMLNRRDVILARMQEYSNNYSSIKY